MDEGLLVHFEAIFRRRILRKLRIPAPEIGVHFCERPIKTKYVNFFGDSAGFNQVNNADYGRLQRVV